MRRHPDRDVVVTDDEVSLILGRRGPPLDFSETPKFSRVDCR